MTLYHVKVLNPTTCIYVYVCIKIYIINVGYMVLIYDRYGQHFSYMKPLLESNKYNIIYHNYTMFEILDPHKYNRTENLSDSVNGIVGQETCICTIYHTILYHIILYYIIEDMYIVI